MRKLALLLGSVVLAIGVLFFGAYTPGGDDKTPAAAAQTAPSKPNIVFILTDDMRKDDLKYMPKTRSVLKVKGMTFENAFVSNSVCCPSRATTMRGQYSHNTGVWANGGSNGGLQAYRSHGGEQDNVATRLDAAGYRTGLFGKYLNGYANKTTYKPPGWDNWFATFQPPWEYFDYDVNDNGTIRHFGTSNSDYQTDVLSRKTNEFIGTSVAQGTPFFAYVSPLAPHVPATPAPRDEHTFDGAKAPRLPSFNERYVSDKPPWIRNLSLLGRHKKRQIDNRHEKRIESLQAVDDLVAGVVNKLNNEGVMNNTYIFFTSDNGYHHGEHRIPSSKWRPYEEDIRVPLLVRGPGVAAGSTTYRLTVNTDYTPTFMELAGSTQNPTYVPDGRSLLPVLRGSVTTWRDAILLEGPQHFQPAYRGIRTSNQKYVRYVGSSAKELYYLGNDPYELTNKYNPNAPPAGLASRLQALESCRAATCRSAENGQ